MTRDPRKEYHAWRRAWRREEYASTKTPLFRHDGVVRRVGQALRGEAWSSLDYAASCGIVRPGIIRISEAKKAIIRAELARFAAAPAPVLP